MLLKLRNNLRRSLLRRDLEIAERQSHQEDEDDDRAPEPANMGERRVSKKTSVHCYRQSTATSVGCTRA